MAVGNKYPVDLKWSRENVFDYGCSCDQPTYAPNDWYNQTIHDSDWFKAEAQKTVIIGGTWYQSDIVWANQNEYFCSYKNQSKLMQKNAYDYSGQDEANNRKYLTGSA